MVLIFVNGLFAGAEIALLTIRQSRLQQLLETKPRRARAVLALRSQPERLLATVQVGITVVGATAAAFGGASVAGDVAAVLARVPGLEPFAPDVALALVIVAISYLSLVVGELVPKSLALRYAESYSLLVGRPLLFVSSLAKPLVWFLTSSSDLLLRPFGDRATFTESRLSPGELQHLVEEAAKTGSLDTESGKIASRALEFGELTAADVMIPRSRIDGIPRNAPPDQVKALLLETGHSRMPVYEGSLDNIVGYITAKDVLALAWEGELIVLDDLIHQAFFVPESSPAPKLLKELQARHAALALVVDEHGGISGLVALEDLIEELVGEIFSEHQIPEELIRREADGSALVRGYAPIRDVNRELSLELPESDAYSTVGGLCLHLAGRIPQRGARLETPEGDRLEVVEASPRAVRLVRLTPRPPEVGEAPPADT
ncbi:MAG: hemolysin family protein [Candidatus Binatia bacterium]